MLDEQGLMLEHLSKKEAPPEAETPLNVLPPKKLDG
jgi:hypothetical protein